MKLNNRGMMLYSFIIFLAIMFIAADSTNLIIFILTKFVGILLTMIIIKMLKYIPNKYLED